MSDEFTALRLRKTSLERLRKLAADELRTPQQMLDWLLAREEGRRTTIIVSAETVASDPASILTAEERAKIGV